MLSCYYSLPLLSIQLNILYRGDSFQLNNLSRGGDVVVSRLDVGLGGGGVVRVGAGVREGKRGNIGIFCLFFR